MVICKSCGNNYDSLLNPNCPHCENKIQQNATFIGRSQQNIQQPCNVDCSSGTCGSSINGNIINSNQELSQSSFIPNQQNYELPKTEIICPQCQHKNKRIHKFCSECLEPLPIYDYKQEREGQVENIVRCLDQSTRENMLLVGIRLFLIKVIGDKIGKDLLRPSKCNAMLSNGTNCQQIVTILNDDCPVCKSPHLRYTCSSCNSYQLATTDLTCPKCKDKTFFGLIYDVINGARGNIQDIIINLESVFKIKLNKETFSSRMQQRSIVQSKLILEQLSGDISEFCKTSAKYLKDTMTESQYFGMKDSFNEINNSWGNQGTSIMGVQSLNIDQSLDEFFDNKIDDSNNNDPLQSPTTKPSDDDFDPTAGLGI